MRTNRRSSLSCGKDDRDCIARPGRTIYRDASAPEIRHHATLGEYAYAGAELVALFEIFRERIEYSGKLRVAAALNFAGASIQRNRLIHVIFPSRTLMSASHLEPHRLL